MSLLESFLAAAAVFFTVGALSLPIRDNLYWKLCEHMYLGFAGGYMLIVAWKAINTNLFNRLITGNIVYVIPLILSIMLYSRYLKGYQWLGRYPTALMVGVGTAVSVRTLVDSMFVSQIAATFINPLAPAAQQVGTIKTPINNILIIVSTLSVLFYFIFIKTNFTENPTARGIRTLGTWFLMLQFGVNLGNGWIMRAARLGARFFYILDPANMLYTGVFAILAILSLYFTGKDPRQQ
jgi:hypothetical protein